MRHNTRVISASECFCDAIKNKVCNGAKFLLEPDALILNSLINNDVASLLLDAKDLRYHYASINERSILIMISMESFRHLLGKYDKIKLDLYKGSNYFPIALIQNMLIDPLFHYNSTSENKKLSQLFKIQKMSEFPDSKAIEKLVGSFKIKESKDTLFEDGVFNEEFYKSITEKMPDQNQKLFIISIFEKLILDLGEQFENCINDYNKRLEIKDNETEPLKQVIEQKNKEIKRLWDIIKSKNNELRSASSNNHEEIEPLTSNVKTEDNNTNTEELKSSLDLSNDRRKECEDLLMKIKNTVASEPVTKSTTKILEDINSYFVNSPFQMQPAETTDTYDSELTHMVNDLNKSIFFETTAKLESDDESKNNNSSDAVNLDIDKFRKTFVKLNDIYKNLGTINNNANKIGNFIFYHSYKKYIKSETLEEYISKSCYQLTEVINKMNKIMKESMKQLETLSVNTLKFGHSYNYILNIARLNDKHMKELINKLDNKNKDKSISNEEIAYSLTSLFAKTNKIGKILDPNYKINIPNISRLSSCLSSLNCTIGIKSPGDIETKKLSLVNELCICYDERNKAEEKYQESIKLFCKDKDPLFSELDLKKMADDKYANEYNTVELYRSMIDKKTKDIELKRNEIARITNENELLNKMFNKPIRKLCTYLDNVGDRYANTTIKVQYKSNPMKILSASTGIMEEYIKSKISASAFNVIKDLILFKAIKPGQIVSLLYIAINIKNCKIPDLFDVYPHLTPSVKPLTLESCLSSMLNRYLNNINTMRSKGDQLYLENAYNMTIGLMYIAMNANFISHSKGIKYMVASDLNDSNLFLGYNSESIMSEIIDNDMICKVSICTDYKLNNSLTFEDHTTKQNMNNQIKTSQEILANLKNYRKSRK